MTLSELLVFMFLMSLMMTATYSVYVLSMRYMLITQASLDLQAQAQKAINTIVHDIADSDAHPNAIITSGTSCVATVNSGSGSIQIDSTTAGWISTKMTAGLTVTVTGGIGIWASTSFVGTAVVPPGTTVTAINTNTNVITVSQAVTATGSTTLGFTSGTDGIIMLSCRDGNGYVQSGPTWQAWVGYYIDGSHNLIRKRIPFASGAPSGVPTAPTATLQANPFIAANGYPSANDFIANFRAASGGTTAVMAIYDTSLVCSGTTPVLVNGTFSTSVFHPGDCQVNILDAVWPRN